MPGGITITEQDVPNIDSVSRAVYDLIQHFNDPKKQHDLCGVFKAGDGLDEIDMKLHQTESAIKEVMSQLNTLRIAVGQARALAKMRAAIDHAEAAEMLASK